MDPINSSHQRAKRFRRIGVALGLLAAIACLPVIRPLSAQDDRDEKGKIGPTLIEQYVQTKWRISEKSNAWREQKRIFQDRISLNERLMAETRERIEKVKKRIEDSKKKRDELQADRNALAKTASVFEERLEELEARTRKLLGRLPVPVKDEVKIYSQQIPKEGEKTTIKSRDRLAHMVAIWNQAAKFNGQISVVPEELKMQDGRSLQVEVLYLGLGQAYYASLDRKLAGTGTYSDEGWVWTPANEHAEAISNAIAIHGGSPAAFIRLPWTLR